MDDYGRDLCSPDKWSEIVASFGLEPAEVVQAQGWRGVRVFTIDGYSRDMPMVSVLARADYQSDHPVDPVLQVRGAKVTGSSDYRPVVLSRPAWTSLAWTAESLQEAVRDAPVRQSEQSGVGTSDSTTSLEGQVVPEGQVADMVICLHAWVTVTESLTSSGVVRRVRNACGDDELFEASFALSAQALRAFPHCNHLDPAQYRNESTQLLRCLSIDGTDLVGAAEVVRLLDARDRSELLPLTEHMAPDAKVSWDGGSVVGPQAAAEAFEGQQLAKGGFDGSLHIGNRDEVIVHGGFDRRRDDGALELADVRQVWKLREGVWVISEMAFGPIEVVLTDE